jgi:hypothetical protein
MRSSPCRVATVGAEWSCQATSGRHEQCPPPATRTYRDDLDLDDIDRAIDQGDLDAVRRHLGLSRRHWFWLLQRL